MNVLITFRHGLGDAVQLTVILQHLRKVHPEWTLHLRALRGKHSVGTMYCGQVWHDQEASPPRNQFDRVFCLDWSDNLHGYHDLPNTKATACLRDVFHIEPEPALLRYRLAITQESEAIAHQYFESIGARRQPNGRFNVVAFHYQGNTAPGRSDLDHHLVALLCQRVLDLGFVPVILDWDQRSPLPDYRRIFCPSTGPGDIWGNTGTGDAERIAALLSQASLMIGVNSGPLKCAGVTETSTIAVWTQQDPMAFFDLCPNVTHLISEDVAQYPVLRQTKCLGYFARNYRHETYKPGGLFDILERRMSSIIRLPALPGVHKPFVVGIPTLTRYEDLDECIASIFASSTQPERIIVIDNGGTYVAKRPNVQIVRPGKNIGCAASWNLLFKLSDPFPLVLCNDDLRLSADVLGSLLSSRADCALAADFSCMRLNRETFNLVGPFDETFWPAYFEDDDYIMRLRLAGKIILDVDHAGVTHHGSATIKHMTPAEGACFNAAWERSRHYYLRKWGGLPEYETYDCPFNGSQPS